MKKIRILSLMLVLLLVALPLVSCGKQAKEFSIKQTFRQVKPIDDTLPTLQTATKLDNMGDLDDTSGDLALFVSTTGGFDTLTVYNLGLGRVVGTYTENETQDYEVNLQSSMAPGYAVNFYTVHGVSVDAAGQATYQTTLYAADGTSVVQANKEIANTPTSFDLVLFDGKCYRAAKDGAMSEAFSWSTTAGNLPDIFAAGKKYYYANLPGGDGFVVLDRSLNTVSRYRFPDHAQGAVYYVLNNGDIWLQYQERLLDSAEKYDLIEETDLFTGETVLYKYNVVQKIMDAKKGTLKDVKTDYVMDIVTVKDIQPFDQEIFTVLKKSIDNVAIGYKIEDQRVSNDVADRLILAVDNNGKVDGVLNRTVEGQINMFTIVADDTILITDILGQRYLYNAKGKEIGNITGTIDRTESYIVGQDKIYDYNLGVIYDYATEGYTYNNTLKTGVL